MDHVILPVRGSVGDLYVYWYICTSPQHMSRTAMTLCVGRVCSVPVYCATGVLYAYHVVEYPERLVVLPVPTNGDSGYSPYQGEYDVRMV